MWDDEGSHELIDAGDVVEPLKAEPKGLGSGLAVTFAAKESAEFGCQSHGFMQGWRITGHDRFSCPIGEKTFPFVVFKENSAGHVRRFSAKLCQMMDAPSHYHVHCQARLYAIGGAQLSLFNLQTALESSMINLDSPTTGIPMDLFNCGLGTVHLTGGDQPPLDGFGAFRWLNFRGQNSPDGEILFSICGRAA